MTAQKKRIPEGFIIANIPLESCKAYPMLLWKDISAKPRIAYSDQKNGETNSLKIKILPKGAKTAPHPQLSFFVQGNYHIEELSYLNSNAFEWRTWIEFQTNTYEIDHLLTSLIKAKNSLRNLNFS